MASPGRMGSQFSVHFQSPDGGGSPPCGGRMLFRSMPAALDSSARLSYAASSSAAASASPLVSLPSSAAAWILRPPVANDWVVQGAG